MKIKILWNLDNGTYPSFFSSVRLNDKDSDLSKNIFHLNEETIALLKEKKCTNFTVASGNYDGDFEEREEVAEIAKKVMSYVKGETNDISPLTEYFC